MATTSPVPLELYLRSSYEPDAEYVDGHIEERPAAQLDHASWQQVIQLWFLQHAREWNIRVRPELRVQVTPTNFRVPDVTVFDRDHPIEQSSPALPSPSSRSSPPRTPCPASCAN